MKKEFRIWDKQDQVLLNWNLITQNTLGHLFRTFFVDYWNRYVVMQFTWLVDKNWVKIYEWDIVEFEEYWVRNNNLENYKVKTEVKFEIDNNSIKLNINNINTNQIEVIWNIYENSFN